MWRAEVCIILRVEFVCRGRAVEDAAHEQKCYVFKESRARLCISTERHIPTLARELLLSALTSAMWGLRQRSKHRRGLFRDPGKAKLPTRTKRYWAARLAPLPDAAQAAAHAGCRRLARLRPIGSRPERARSVDALFLYAADRHRAHSRCTDATLQFADRWRIPIEHPLRIRLTSPSQLLLAAVFLLVAASGVFSPERAETDPQKNANRGVWAAIYLFLCARWTSELAAEANGRWTYPSIPFHTAQ